MVDRLISVGDAFELPPAVKVLDGNLPSRLGEAALSSTIAGEVEPLRPDFIARFNEAGAVAAHRLALRLFPEMSMEGARAAGEAGFILEVDVRPLADGTWVLCHDNTADRTMNITGTVSTLTKEQWVNARIDPVIPGGRAAMPALWDDFLAEFGGKYPIVAEYKTGTVSSLVDSVKNRGLEKAVVLAAAQFVNASALAAGGALAQYVIGGSLPAETPAQIKAAGIDYIGASETLSASNVSTLKGAGLKVWAYTVNTTTSYATVKANGFDGIFTDDPWGVTGRYITDSIESFRSGYLWPLASTYVSAGATLALDPAIPGIKFGYVGPGTTQSAIRLGQFGKGPAVSRIRFDIQFNAGASQTDRWIALWVGTESSDAAFLDTGTPGTVDGYNFLIRRNGAKTIYKRSNGSTAATQLATHSSAAFTPDVNTDSATLKFEVVIDAANVTLRCLTDGTSATVADATYRGTNAMLSLLANSTAVTISDIRVTR